MIALELVSQDGRPFGETCPAGEVRAVVPATRGLLRTVGRRAIAAIAAICAAVSMALLSTGVAHADSSGNADCTHLGRTTFVEEPLPQVHAPGYTLQLWLWRASGGQWVYTGSTLWARNVGGGSWMLSNGTPASTGELMFPVAANSGAYILSSRISAPNGAHSDAWLSGYDYDNTYRFATYCQS